MISRITRYGEPVMLRWEWIALGYFSCLVLVATVRPGFARARRPAIACGAAAWLLLPLEATRRDGWTSDLLPALLPVPVLLIGYWLSGCFFVEPMPRVERWLRRIDEVLLRPIGAWRWSTAAKKQIRGYLELAYLLVYVVVPAGAILLVIEGRADAVDGFWACVMLAAFASYGMLPWLQTRPPRAVDDVDRRAADAAPPWLRRLNLWVLGRASIQVNTVPSGHAATATAVALSVGAAVPEARPILFVIAASIVAATVVGRYHYVVDSVAGVLVGLCAWALVVAFN